jgi:hypothetical protein
MAVAFLARVVGDSAATLKTSLRDWSVKVVNARRGD